MKKYFSFIIVLSVIFLGAFFVVKNSHAPTRPIVNYKFVYFGNTKVNAEVVSTEASRERGLSFRTSLSEGEGMLFVFESEGKYGFWMKDMNFAIDMIWFDAQKKIVFIKKDARPENFPESYGDEVLAKYVLEVPSGFTEVHGLKVGDKAEF